MAKKIISLSNQKNINYSKLKSSKYRSETGLFIVEGFKALEDIIENNITIRDILITSEDALKGIKLSEDINVSIVPQAVIKKVSGTDSPPKIITIAEQISGKIADFLSFNRIILLENISDPGNLGTIIRDTAAFGFDGIILTGNCVDIYNPKVIRSSAGNFFKVPIIKTDRLTAEFKDFKLYTTYLHSTNSVTSDKLTPSDKFILSFGSEASGLSEEFMKNSYKNVIIRTQNVESLNIATSAAILMYEFSKH